MRCVLGWLLLTCKDNGCWSWVASLKNEKVYIVVMMPRRRLCKKVVKIPM